MALYRLAHFCIVSSLHDGMNLVAKEFVAARDDDDGVLVLSALAGAAQELRDALIINPYDVDGFADALEAAIDMPRDERRARMRAMRRASPDATCSAGPRTSSRDSKACGPSRCTTPCGGGRRCRCEEANAGRSCGGSEHRPTRNGATVGRVLLDRALRRV